MTELSLSQSSASPPERVRFAAVLHPHTSLSPRAFAVMMIGLATFSFVLGGASMAMGFWPVMGFYGLDLLALYAAFRISYRRARRYETLELTEDTLTVLKVDPNGRRRRIEFQPYWLRVEFDDPPRPESRLVLASHGQAFEIGAFLTPGEKLDFARALRRELAKLRASPVQTAS